MRLTLKFWPQLIPSELRIKWQADLESVNSKVCGSEATKQISSLLIMLETPEEMVVLCSAGKPDILLTRIGTTSIYSIHGKFHLRQILPIAHTVSILQK